MALCFERFGDFRDYINRVQYFSCLKDSKYSWYNAATIPVTSFQCNKHAVHTVRYTGSTRWRNHMPSRNDTVLLRMGMSLDRHFKWTAGQIPGCVKCLFVVKDAESSIIGFVALVQLLATRRIHQTAGMIIVEERQHPPMQPLCDGSYHHKPLFSIGTPYILPKSAIQGSVHRLPLTPQADIMRWHMSTTIDLNDFNLFYMYII